MEKLKIMEWNINGRSSYGNYTVPVKLIADEIWEIEPDILILTEFVKSLGWGSLKDILEERYYIKSTSYVNGQNGILIGVRKRDRLCLVDNSKRERLGEENDNCNMPDFLQVEVQIDGKPYQIIGTRVRIGCRKRGLPEQKSRMEQFLCLSNYIKSLDNVIVAGDFNNNRILGKEDSTYQDVEDEYADKVSKDYNYQLICSKLDEKYKFATPAGNLSSMGIYEKEYYGKCRQIGEVYVREDEKQRHKYDHFIVNKEINISCQYLWEFLKKRKCGDIFIYNRNKCGYEMKIGFPDHAILVGEMEI